MTRDVLFVEPADNPGPAIDEAFRRKYARYGDSYVRSINGPTATAATLRLVPQD